MKQESLLKEIFDVNCFYTLDIGARGGLHPVFNKFLKYLDLDAFDPDEEECKKQQLNFDNNVNFVPIALTKETKSYPFYLLNYPSGSSLFKPNMHLPLPPPFRLPDDYAVDEILQIKGMSFEDYRLKHNKPKPFFIKLDTQGSELDILKGFGEMNWENIVSIETEIEFVEQYEEQPLFQDIHNYLTDKGFYLFELHRQPTYLHRKGENKYFYLDKFLKLFKGSYQNLSSFYLGADAVYMKFPSKQDLDTNQKFLSYILGGFMYGNYDLICWLLDHEDSYEYLSVNQRKVILNLLKKYSPRPRGIKYFFKKAKLFLSAKFKIIF